MKEDKTIRYYNLNAREFALGTVSVDFEFTQKKFTDRLPKNAQFLILDAARDAIQNIFYHKDTG